MPNQLLDRNFLWHHAVTSASEREAAYVIDGLMHNYLSHKIGQEKDPERRQELLRIVQNGSVSSWGHVNLHGEYDFADEKMQDSIGLQMPPDLALNLL